MRRLIVPCFLPIFILLHLSSLTLYAQSRDIKFEHLLMEKNSELCIFQDRQGFMWFGTQEGLARYDGYGFTVYKQDVFDSTSLSSNVIWSIHEDQDGTLWVGTGGGGLNKFDRKTQKFTHFAHDPKDPHSLSYNIIFACLEDHAGELWIGTGGGGLNKLDRQTGKFNHFVHDPKNPHSLSSNIIWSIYESRQRRDGTLWIGTEGGGLNKFDHRTEQFTHFIHDPQNPHSLSHNTVKSIYEDRSGTLWIGTDGGGLNKFDRETEQFIRFFHDPKNPHSLSHNLVRTIYEDRTGTFWVGTGGGGLNILDRKTGQFTRLLHDPQDSRSLSDNNVVSIHEDRTGLIWIGTWSGGVNIFDRTKERFIQFINDPQNSQSLSHNFVTSICRDRDGTYWVGTRSGGLNQFDRRSGKFVNLIHDPRNSFSLSNNAVGVIFEDHAGLLWVATANGLDRYDRKTRKFVHFVPDPKNPHSLSHHVVRSIYEDRSGTLWIGTDLAGLNRFDVKTEQFTHFFNDPNNPHSLCHNRVDVIYEDRFGTLWIGTAGGLNRFDRKTEQFTHFVHDPNNPNSLSHNWITAICEDRSGTLWVGTGGGGLDRFDRDTGQFTHYTEKDGLFNSIISIICGILADERDRLWLSTAAGLSCFVPSRPAGKIFRNYDVADGLPSDEFTLGAYHKSASGEMFFGSFHGLAVFHPDSIKDNPYIPPVVITAFKRYNTDEAEGIAIAEKGISTKKEIEVSYKDNFLSFEFAALSYRNTFKNQYAYKLEGFNDNWIQLGTKRDVTFTNLDAGEYTLRVKGSNNDGIWNEEGVSLKITITPPWWRTRWAYAFYVSLFTLLLYGWRRFELNRVKLRNELKMKNFEAQKLQEMDQMKSRFFVNISHEFRTPLTLILGPVEQMRGKQFKGNLDEAYDMILRNGRRLLRLINQLLDLARLEAGRLSLQTRPENIVSFLKGLVLSFASAAERKRITLRVTAEEENLIVYFDRDKLEKIVSNLLSNALKFTPEGGSVTVAVGSERRMRGEEQRAKGEYRPSPFALHPSPDEFVEISVTDTGPGIPYEQFDKIFDRFYQVDASQTREHEGTGIGLALTKELVELHHGEIRVRSEVGHGTTFIVRLPLGKAHLKPEEVVEAVTSEQLPVSSDQFSVVSDQSTRFEDQSSSLRDRATSNQRPATSNQQRATSRRNHHPRRRRQPRRAGVYSAVS